MIPSPRPLTAAPRTFTLALACLLALTCLLARAAPALAVSDDPVLRRMDAVLEENARLRDEAWKARKNGREAAQKAEEALSASEDRVEKTRAEALAHVAGVSPAQVESLRRDGRSWGQAAGELGVHPGFLGVGKTPMYEPQSARKAAQAENAKQKGKRLGRKKAEARPEAKAKPAKALKAAKKAPPKPAALDKKTTARPDKPAKAKKPGKKAETPERRT